MPDTPITGSENEQHDFSTLVEYLQKIPAVSKRGRIGSGSHDAGHWWVKFEIDIGHPLAWHAVQELGFVLNYVSLSERLPTKFYPVSPPPYLNGGPSDFLSWVIENTDPQFLPDMAQQWLEGRLPQPVDDLTQWNTE
jgi:hypothetical protein